MSICRYFAIFLALSGWICLLFGATMVTPSVILIASSCIVATLVALGDEILSVLRSPYTITTSVTVGDAAQQ